MKFPSYADQIKTLHLLQNEHGGGRLDARLARLLGWRDVEVKYVKEGNVTKRRAVGYPPDWNWDDKATFPDAEDSFDAFYEVMKGRLYPDDGNQELMERFLDWVQVDCETRSFLVFSYPFVKCAAAIMALEGYVPLPNHRRGREMNLGQEAADELHERGLELMPRPGQVVITPPSTSQRLAHEERAKAEGTYHLIQFARGEITSEECHRIQLQVRLERRRRRAAVRLQRRNT